MPENVEEKDSQFTFKGSWLPDADPSKIGPENFQSLINMRYIDQGITGVNGYSKITTDALTTYTNIRQALQLITDRTTKSYIFVQSKDGSGQGRVHVFKTTPPGTGTWETSHIHEDVSTGLDARMSIAPHGHIFYCNGSESMIYAGEEMEVAAFISLTASLGSELISDVNDRTFAAASNWANTDINAYDETGDLTITADASGQYCSLGTAFAPMTAGTMYRITFDVANIVSGWIIKDDGDNDTIATITTNGSHSFCYAPTTAGGFRIESNASDSSADFDDFSVKEITLSEPIEHTEKINNTLQTAGEYVSTVTQKDWFVFTTRPLKRVRYLIKTANTTDSVLSVSNYKVTGWENVTTLVDGTSTGGKAMAQDGFVSFDDTEDDATPFHYQGLYLYAYHFELSAGTAEFYHVSADADWQTVKDVWDGVYRQPIQAQVKISSSVTASDYTLQVNEYSTVDAPFGMVLNSLTATGEIIIMSEERLAAIQLTMQGAKVNSNASIATFERWDGTAFVAVDNFTDGTSDGGKTIAQTGALTWTPPDKEDEPPHYLYGTPGYAYQITVSATLSADVMVDVITCIPVQLTVKPFKFSGTFKNRVMLGGYTAGKQGNRMDYGVTNAPDVFNGYESSMDGFQSLYYGGVGDLTCATEIYNRFGANIFTLYLVFKATEAYVLSGDSPEDFKIFPVSYNVGCPAPNTLCNAELGFEMADNVYRNVAMWISYSGPVMFDGAVIKPLDGINTYFDPKGETHINFDEIGISYAEYDPLRKEWNLNIPTGTNTVCDTWLVYDMKRNRWFVKDPSPQYLPQVVFNVQDEAGTKYLYGATDDGRLMHLENGYSWDGSGIIQTVHPGDFWPTENIWHLTEGRYLKLAAKRMVEDVDLEVIYYKDTESDSGVGVTYYDGDIDFVDVTASMTVSGLAGVAWAAPTLSVLNFDLSRGLARIVRDTGPLNSIQAWCHSFKFKITTSNTAGGFKPIFWGFSHRFLRKDIQPQQG